MPELQKFSVLAATTVTNTGQTVVAKGVGVYPGTAVTGFPPGTRGQPGDAKAAMAELQKLFADLGRVAAITRDLTGKDLGGMILRPGVYKFDSS